MDTNTCEYSSFDIFSRPMTEVGLEEVQEHQILPLTALNKNTSTIEFDVTGSGDEYVDLSSLRLYLRVKVTKEDGSEPEAAKIKLIQHWSQSLFRQVDLFLNGTLVTTSSNLYHYGAFISTLLSSPSEVKKNMLKALEHLDEWKVLAGPKGNTTEALIRLHIPLCRQQRFLMNGVNVHLRLLRTSPEFLFMRQDATDTTKYALDIEKCSLFVKKLTPSSSLLLQHTEELSKRNAVYPIERIWPKFFTLGTGLRDFDLNNVCQGQLPNRIVVGLVQSSAFSGSYKSDPYKFEHFKLSNISLTCNGKLVPAVPYDLDFSSDVCRRAYYNLLDTIQGPCMEATDVGIDLTQYKENSCLYGFTLNRTLSGPNESLPTRENGYINAKVTFQEALPSNVIAIFFMEFNNFVEIDSARNIYLDYAA